MKKFLLNVIIFISIIVSLLTIGLFIVSDSGTLGFDTELNGFSSKIESFEKSTEKEKSINLFLGSSLVGYSIFSNLIGKHWYTFYSNEQNIYNSYKFLKFYQDSIKIDSIIIGIQPFDFPFSYIKNKKLTLPFNNYSFYHFGTDSINPYPLKRKIQLRKNKFFSLKNIFSNLRPKKKKNIQFDSFNTSSNIKEVYQNWASQYFFNVNTNPNMKYFDLFMDLSDSLNIKVIYLVTPKSKKYHLDMNKYKYDITWENIIDSIEIRQVEIWNYEKYFNNYPDLNLFKDETHLNLKGMKKFTNIIKKRLGE